MIGQLWSGMASALGANAQPSRREIELGQPPDFVRSLMDAVYARGDRLMRLFILVHFAVGLLLAFFYGTWLMALIVGGAAVAMVFISTALVPRSFLTRCIAGVALQCFVALHVYQLHGMPEMHFFFFTAYTILIVYQDWRSMWPGTVFIILQHILFAILHNSGVPLYFFEDPYISVRKLFFHFSIAIAQVAICGYWAYLLRRQTLMDGVNRASLSRGQELLAEQLQQSRAAHAALEISEAKLQEAHEQLDSLFRCAPFGLTVWDRQSRFLRLNEVMARMNSLPVESHLGRTMTDLQTGTAGEMTEAVQRVLQTGGLVHQQLHKAASPSAEERYWAVVYYPLSAKGQTVGVGAICQDVTEQHVAHEELLRSNEELQQFTFAASHDLQEPLRTISAYSQLISKRYCEKFGGEEDEFVPYVVEAAARLSHLIRDLLEYSRLGLADAAPYRPVDALDALQAARANLETALQESNAVLTYEPLPVVLGRQSLLVQVFQNLIGNAIKYSREGVPPRIHVAAHRQSGEWLFSVQDNGQGFKQEYAERIFGVFKRLHNKQYAGTGIGLSVCKRIVERLGGRIWAESIEGQGTIFYFVLPLLSIPETEAVEATVQSRAVGKAS